MISGVPQGTVLGPVLFILYMNDIVNSISHCEIGSFADDTRVLKEIETESDVKLLQEDLNEAVRYSVKNNMLLHTDKFELVCHATGRANLLQELPFSTQYYEYTTQDGTIITPVDSVIDLGIKVTSDVTWSSHIGIITDGARRMSSWVLSVFRDRSTDTMMKLYTSLIRSKLEYCSALWNPSKMEDIIKLEGI